MGMGKSVTGYLKKAKRQLRRAGDRDGEYFSIFRQEVDTYCAEHPQATAAEVQAHFGTPSEQVAEYLQTMPGEELAIKLTSRRRLFSFAKIVLAISAAAIILLLAIHVADTWSYNHGYVVISPAYEGIAPPDPNAIATY